MLQTVKTIRTPFTLPIGAALLGLDAGGSMNIQPEKDMLSLGERVGELAAVIAMTLLFAFFIYHQANDTGFFTSKFGTLEMFLLYGPILLSYPAPLIRAFSGHRNPSRPFEAFDSLFLGVAAIWFLVEFPFDFEYLPEPLPDDLEFLLSWVNNDIAKIPLILQAVVGPITAFVVMFRYLTFRVKTTAHATQI
jgi:hypothetical protein